MNNKLVHIHKKSTFVIFFIYLYAFLIIYMPPITNLLFGVPIHLFTTFLLCFTIIPFILRKIKQFNNIYFRKEILFLYLGVTLSVIYFGVRASIESNDIRLLQNIFILVQITHFLIIIDKLKIRGYQKDDLIKFLFNIGLIQSVICILMLVIPEFRNLALSLYYLGSEENIFISRMRIYGVSGDYTYFTPIFHGLLAVTAFTFAVLKNFKYIFYIPFFILTILINGRFGLVIFFIGICFVIFSLIIKRKSLLKVINYIIITIVVFSLMFLLVRFANPYTYTWIMNGFENTITLLIDKEVEGNYTALIDNHLFFPENWGLLIGEGHRVFGVYARSHGYHHSDIGYVNDMFMGGLLYVSILYVTLFTFIMNRGGKEASLKKGYYSQINKILSFVFIFSLLLANYKGEAMRGGLIVLGVIFIKLIILDKDTE